MNAVLADGGWVVPVTHDVFCRVWRLGDGRIVGARHATPIPNDWPPPGAVELVPAPDHAPPCLRDCLHDIIRQSDGNPAPLTDDVLDVLADHGIAARCG